MKSLYESLLDDFDTLNDKINNYPKEEIKKFLKENYKSPSSFKISAKPNKDGLYIVTSKNKKVIVMNRQIEYLTNDLFVFGDIYNFDCAWCRNLKTLKGISETIKGDFNCHSCESLTSFEGAPKYVEGDFYGGWCENLTSLKGSPELIIGSFSCFACKALTSLKGAPKKVDGKFVCGKCGKQFTEDEVRAVSNVSGVVDVNN